MQDTVSIASRPDGRPRVRPSILSRAKSDAPSLRELALALVSAALLIVSFPDFNLWPLAWMAMVPLLGAIGSSPKPWAAFLLGWLFGSVFFFGSCHWLTYSIINFGRFPSWLAYTMLIPGALALGLFPGLFASVVARLIQKLGKGALFLAPLIWAPLEWSRLEVTGQLWNAIGYSQAFHPKLIQTSRWAGVYAVGFLIVWVNASIAFALLRRRVSALLISVAAVLLAGLIVILSMPRSEIKALVRPEDVAAVVIAIQPNVPMDLVKTPDEMAQLNERHFQMSEVALNGVPNDGTPRLLIWPESPMYFTYGGDSQLRERLSQFAKRHHTSVLLNSQEAAPNDGIYNSALLINEEGGLVAQYDKIRLLPFGEYVPLPQWLPGAGLIRGIVGDFVPGTNYRLMPVGNSRAGVFICIESAYPTIASRFTREGADVLINISNDGYLGPTAVMHQHLANAVFRAVENNRRLLRVTNTGITALIGERGEVTDATRPFQQEVRVWRIWRHSEPPSFYAKHGDVFVVIWAVLGIAALVWSFKSRSIRKTFG